jgi:hypothetical protein
MDDGDEDALGSPTLSAFCCVFKHKIPQTQWLGDCYTWQYVRGSCQDIERDAEGVNTLDFILSSMLQISGALPSLPLYTYMARCLGTGTYFFSCTDCKVYRGERNVRAEGD